MLGVGGEVLGFRSFTWRRNCIISLKPHFYYIHNSCAVSGHPTFFPDEQMFCEQSPAELGSAWPPGSYSSQGGTAGAKESARSQSP